MIRTVKVKEKPVRKPLDTSLLPVKEIDLYPEGTATEDGKLKDDFVEIGTEETLRLERIPEKAYIVKTIRHKVIRKSELKEKHPEERHILIRVGTNFFYFAIRTLSDAYLRSLFGFQQYPPNIIMAYEDE